MPVPIILVAHGSPDPDWRAPLEALRERLQAQVPGRPVHLAYMELCEPKLTQVAHALAEAGHERVVVLAAFMSPGGRHIKRDLPELVARSSASAAIELVLVPGALGMDDEVIDALARAAVRAAGEHD